VCDHSDLSLILDLGRTALANRFLTPEMAAEAEPIYPLRLVRCGGCGLVQIDETVPPEDLFGHYLYLSQTSDLVKRHAEHLAQSFSERYGLSPNDLVLEVASNDGTVLQAFQRRGHRLLGVEPAANIAALAREAGIPTKCEFFNAATARALRKTVGPARLVLARHVLAHVAELDDFVQGLETVLSDDGVLAIEVPHLLPFYQNLEYDTVYHEHLCYFSVHVIERLFEKHGLELIDVESVAIHGGSVLVTAQRQSGPNFVRSSVEDAIYQEEKAGLHQAEAWTDFAARVEGSRDRLNFEIDTLLERGKHIAAYGAAAKGMALLAYCGLDARRLPYIVDKSPLKQGRLTPGHRIPVVGPEQLLTDQPDVLLLLAWNFAEEIVAQQSEYRKRGGRFLLPIPEPRYWGESKHGVSFEPRARNSGVPSRDAIAYEYRE
jgi:novobiocin biosynthesis protein NovU/D-mycarose 3-C-methyltransferase